MTLVESRKGWQRGANKAAIPVAALDIGRAYEDGAWQAAQNIFPFELVSGWLFGVIWLQAWTKKMQT